MSLTDQFADELRSPSLAGRVVGVVDGGDRLTVGIEQDDRLAVSFWSLELHTDRLRAAEVSRVKRVAQQITQRVTYLLEPLTECETDQLTCVVQLRSTQPERDGDARAYYEILVKSGGSIALTRYRKEPGALRRPVAAELTKAVLVRLAGDFLAALA
ncbi:hypothetical protein Pla175_33520 [Pirellulimonas nuda]|uniref:Uncharacterized protein n=1 Tax=Pirellulimonas nuda TaxID=2528009 RepID=A0A518DEP9_9BACT|nr:hypothetical protein [Pirellulimonas nuda]QDU89955.1 hypothetical protein Pla175_33520 [Pirellulimonas nuda]